MQEMEVLKLVKQVFCTCCINASCQLIYTVYENGYQKRLNIHSIIYGFELQLNLSYRDTAINKKNCLKKPKFPVKFRELHEKMKRYTWRKPTPIKQARLDFFLITENLMPSVQKVDILPSYRSDHSTVVLSIKINEFKKGSGLWKFNNSLLKDSEYIKTINTKNNIWYQFII